MAAPRSSSGHWVRAFSYGLLAEITTIVAIVITVQIYRRMVAPGLTDATYAAFDAQAGGVIGVIGGTIFTFVFAHALMSRLINRFIAHGLVVAAGAILLQLAGSLAGHGGFPYMYVVADLLKLGAGWLAGFLAERRLLVPTGGG
jgi:hypothetical protein